MNERFYINTGECGDFVKVFKPLLVEDEPLMRKYLNVAQDVRELDQLYHMMCYNLENIFTVYELFLDDRVVRHDGKAVDGIGINAMISNAISSAKTLMEALAVFDQTYISEEQQFKKQYISAAYDEYFSYRMVDFLRNYLQHGHVPISYDGERIFINMAEILETRHLKMNSKLEKQFQKIKEELFANGSMETRIHCVLMFHEYFLLIHTIYLEFWNYASWSLENLYSKVLERLELHPEYIELVDGYPFVAVYVDEQNLKHGFLANADFKKGIETIKAFARETIEDYQISNGNLCKIIIHYHLENRVPELLLIDDSVFTENLVSYCQKHGHEIHHVSFDKYFGRMSDYAVHQIFPYMMFEDGIHWNVPYDQVTIADFMRTFPEVKRAGIEIDVNNVAGGGPFDEIIRYAYRAFVWLDQLLKSDGVTVAKEVLDWCSRIHMVYQMMQSFSKSFGKKKEEKPDLRYLKHYLRRNEQWDLKALSRSLNCEEDLLRILLVGLGYRSEDEKIYVYDAEQAKKIMMVYERCQEEDQQSTQRLAEAYGMSIQSLKDEVECLNADLLYRYLELKEQGMQSVEAEEMLQKQLQPLKKYEAWLYWDVQSLSVKIAVNQMVETTGEEVEEAMHLLSRMNAGLYEF